MHSARELLATARSTYTQRQVAHALGISERTVARWEGSMIEPPQMVIPALREFLRISPLPEQAGSFRFVDLFARIGGTRIAFELAGGTCVFTSEWDKWAQKTYRANFIDDENSAHVFMGDITAIDATEVPDHDVLVAGFPCQPFSIAGVSKKNALGRLHGFQDATQGTLFFDVARIIAEKRPVAFLLENVKNLRSHDAGRTFKVIQATLRDELGYELHHRVINGKHFTPQNRERIFIVGFRQPTEFDFDEFVPPDMSTRLEDILHTSGQPIPVHDGDRFVDLERGCAREKYTLTQHLWEYLVAYAAKHKAAGNGFGFGLADPSGITRTLSARYYKDGSEILIPQVGGVPRRLTPRECARLMGFPDDFIIPVSDTQAYKQFGNSVVVPAVAAVAALIAPHVEAILGHPEQGVA